MCKSAIYVVNTAAQTVAVNGTIALGSAVRRFGCAIDLNGNSVLLDEAGYYDIAISIVAEPTAAGTVTAVLYNNGVAVPGATASATAAAANDPVNLSIDGMVRVGCNGNTGVLTVVLIGTESVVTNIAEVVTKI